MSELDELYQAIILDHNRRPRNFGEMAEASGHAQGKNPLCGDEVSVWVRVEDNQIADITFKGIGCAISRATASMMTTAVKGKSREEAADLFGRFHSVVTGKISQEEAAKMEKPIAVFAGVSRFPVRVKCAVLPWHTLRSALEDEGGGEKVVSTEREGPGGAGREPAVTGGGA
jgi:nitrogen fixation NifU-like protein